MFMQPEFTHPPAETWENWQFLGIVLFVVGLIVLIVGAALRVNSGRRRPIAGFIVIFCAAICIIGGVMSIGKIDEPDGFWGTLGQPCYDFRTNEQGAAEPRLSEDEFTECVEKHYSQTTTGVYGIVFGFALALSGAWLVREPRHVSQPTPSPSPSKL